MADGFDRFTVAMRRRGREVERGAVRTQQKAVLAVGTALVLNTPVDTGHARGNWRASLNAVPTREIEVFDPSGASTIASIISVVSGVRPGSTVFLANNVPYIGLLNEGYSPQQPAGWVERSVEEGQRVAETEGAEVFRR